ncbi:AraC family transcriptional regulator [Sphingobacterium corticibacter]|uniref:AraC family transcriptional regulator n=1 Tax=Sphingobacterium corticibacter TaxID=2171749 RepID=A0A2T8HMC3_9SPHI|nr:AraC family transcriptional regulator [Sphingobacterium corticibacter]PVH26577.1 AraC family transcriptional regulator [Sphingobacterium corticibacter]
MQKLHRYESETQSFQIRKDHIPQYHQIWHYHEELELIYINRGLGTFFIGDCIQRFEHGACVLIGKNVPHYWHFDEEYSQEAQAEIYVIHFREDFAGKDFLALPELAEVRRTVQQAQKGLWIEALPFAIALLFQDLEKETSGFQQLYRLLQVLHEFTQFAPKVSLVSSDYDIQQQHEEVTRMNTIIGYINTHYRGELELTTLANLSGMTRNSFCRYFKQRTGKTLTAFITALRVAHACKLLRDSGATIKESCFDAGFNNFVSFHKAFKKITGTTPLAYRRTFS